ncbi:hypothetical protein LEP1GSC193_2469 [Leptospira alstonii serovar Pingchang str. 80-412]|uniref:Uncharacterized protein n=2 Tax=Leptospira alstonii TaxID=28452 RepID=M6D2F6_9LEPT|nr:hypothetical protein LEP1GSC194_2507 [Leptospira alstonii serovar Sichuan str. 79601]EQA80921.1 hypothetical protein LEP1GSC193_2469 [Leptospira alstonii serovar Pingchang str. 80-412]
MFYDSFIESSFPLLRQFWANPSPFFLTEKKRGAALSAPINKLIDRSKSEIFLSFQFVDSASIAFALAI